MGGAVMSYRHTYENLYKQKLNTLMVRENGKVSYKAYRGTKGKYYIHIKVPSETVKNFYYDVVFEFFLDDKQKAEPNNLKNYSVRFYSNDPAFVFTFAHTFMEKKLFITELKDKMSVEAIKQKATEKNPNNIVGYVKTFFFAYLMMEQKGLFNKFRYVEKFNWNIMKADIEDASSKINERLKSAEISKKNKEDERARRKEIDLNYRGARHGRELKKAIKQSKSSNKVKTTKTVRTVNNVKKTKKI